MQNDGGCIHWLLIRNNTNKCLEEDIVNLVSVVLKLAEECTGLFDKEVTWF